MDPLVILLLVASVAVVGFFIYRQNKKNAAATSDPRPGRGDGPGDGTELN